MNSQETTIRQAVLAEAYYDHKKKLNSYAYLKVRNQAVSEDLVEETFSKTWKFLVKGGQVDIMKAFLYHILNNLIVDEYRKRKTLSLDAILEKGFEPAADTSENLMDALDGKAAMQLIQRLSPTYQNVIRMRYVQGLSLKEISLITGKSKNTMAVQVHRGLAKLKQLYTNPSSHFETGGRLTEQHRPLQFGTR